MWCVRLSHLFYSAAIHSSGCQYNRRKQMPHFLTAASCPKLHSTHPTMNYWNTHIIRMPMVYVVEKNGWIMVSSRGVKKVCS